MGMFNGIDKTKAAANGGDYIKPGHYLARINRVKAGDSQNGKGSYVAVEMTVLLAYPDGSPVLNAAWEPLGADHWHRPGEPISHIFMEKHQSFLANFKAFVANVGGLPESEVTEDQCEAVTGDGVFEGLFVDVSARTIKTRAGGQFTKVGFMREVLPSEVADQVDEQVLNQVLGVGKIDELIAEQDA